MRWAVGVLVLAALLFAANYVFVGTTVPRMVPPRVVAAPPVAPPPAPAPEPLPAPPAPGTAVLVGRVLTADDGKPVAGAVMDYDGRRPFVRSGPDGSYRLEGIAPGRHSIGAFPEGYAYASRWREFVGGETVPLDFFVLRGADIEGTVRADGGPVAGATVSVYEGTKSVTTGKDGTFVLRGFRPQSEFLEVAAAGFLPQTFCVEVPPGEVRVPCVLDLRPSWKVVGTVLLDGKPVPGARVAPTWRKIAGEEFTGATTAADGTFVLESAEEPEDGVVWAWTGGMALGCSGEIDLADGMTHDGVVVAMPSIRRLPFALEDEAGKPVAGASLHARLSAEATQDLDVDVGAMDLGDSPGPLRTDAEGKAVLEVPAGRWQVRIAAEGFFGEDHEFGIEDPVPPMPFVLRRGGDLEGRVVDGAGHPVAGAEVRVRVPGPFEDPRVLTGADGRFLFRSLVDEKLDVEVEKAGFSADPAEGVRPGTPLTFTLLPASTVRGSVVLPGGKGPARAFTIRLYYRAREDGFPWPGGGVPFFEDEVADAGGTFAIPDVEPGTVEAEAECGTLLSRRVPVVTKAGTDPAGIELALAPSASLSGRVLDAAGKPAAGASVRLLPPEQVGEDWPRGRTAAADDSGGFRFLVLSAGRLFLLVEQEGFFRMQVPVDLESGVAAKRDVVLSRGGELVLETVDATGEYTTFDSLDFLEDVGSERREKNAVDEEDAEEASDERREVRVIRGEWEGNVRSLSLRDFHEILRIAPGSYRARLRADDCEPVDLHIVVKEGETTVVKAVLRKSP